ncbi:MAG: glycoside hydrolase family 97 N-terminal domain-containing protein, partial [Bacteroidales bacterium]|nr:glycoside hydrolase family 97 N-terminal domain-containing protein [Bacteroidales bacterium]
MKKIFLLLLLAVIGTSAAFAYTPTTYAPLKSPDGRMEMTLKYWGAPFPGYITYSLSRDGKEVVFDSRLGFKMEWRKSDLANGFRILKTERSSFDETWQPVWGEEANIRNHYNELAVTLVQDHYLDYEGKRVDKPTVMIVRFRLYNDGLAFRYEWPQEAENGKRKAESEADATDNNAITNSLVTFWLTEELTEFRLAGDHTAWWIPGDYDTQEFNYTKSRLSEVSKLHNNPHLTGGWPWKSFSDSGVQTALQMKTDDGLYINIHEAAVLDFPTMNLDVQAEIDTSIFKSPLLPTLRVHLTPDATGYVGRLTAPCYSPWRTIQVCETATDVLRSRLILNLNEPCALEDVSWIHPVKYMGVWWE